MKLLGRTDIEDALKRLDRLIQEELQMVTAQILKVATEGKDGIYDRIAATITLNSCMLRCRQRQHSSAAGVERRGGSKVYGIPSHIASVGD